MGVGNGATARGRAPPIPIPFAGMMKTTATISPMQIDDCDAAIAIWSQAEGVCLSESDSRDGIALFLRRNPGSSFVAKANGHIVGAVLCGHDGRRGHIYHLGVDVSMRKQGVGTALLSRCMRALADSGITVCRASVMTSNVEAQKFWKAVGWSERNHLKPFTRLTQEESGEPPDGSGSASDSDGRKE